MNAWQAARGHQSPVTGHPVTAVAVAVAVAVVVSRGGLLGSGQCTSPQVDTVGSLAGWQAGRSHSKVGLALEQLGGVALERGKWQKCRCNAVD